MQLFLDQQQFQVQINTHLLPYRVPPLRQQDNGGLSQKKYNAHDCDDNMSPSATVHLIFMVLQKTRTELYVTEEYALSGFS